MLEINLIHNFLRVLVLRNNKLDYWSTYMRPNFLLDPIMHRHQSGRSSAQHIRNERSQ